MDQFGGTKLTVTASAVGAGKSLLADPGCLASRATETKIFRCSVYAYRLETFACDFPRGWSGEQS